MLDIYVDADACPVKDEIYKVAQRCGMKVFVVANQWMRIPESPTIERVIVGTEGLDVADDWIAERIGPGDIAVTADIPLADRCVKAGARAVSPKGRVFDEGSIGEQLATRNLMADLREAGTVTGGPAPMSKADRSNFLRAMDLLVTKIKREGR